MDNLKAITAMLERQSGIVTTAQVSAAGRGQIRLTKSISSQSFYGAKL